MAKKSAVAAEATVSKMEAVRQTLTAGIEKAQEGIVHVKEKFGLDIPAAIFSSYKSVINSKKGSTPGKRGRKPKTDSAGPAAATRRGDVEGMVHLTQEVKALVGRYGADAVKGMADVFAD